MVFQIKSYILSIIGASLLWCCDSRHENYDSAGARVLPLKLEERHLELADVFDRIEVIPLETNDSCLIKEVGRVICRDEEIYLFNVSKVLRFRSDGSFVNRVGRKGRGPGEYVYVSDFEIDGATGNVFILSPFGSVYSYTPDGEFLEKYDLSFQPNYQNLRQYNDSSWMCWTLSEIDDVAPITFLNKDFSTEISTPKINVHRADMSRGEPGISRYKGKIYAGFVFGSGIYEISPDSAVRRFVWDFGRDMTSEATLSKYDGELDNDWRVNVKRDEEFFNDLGIKYFQGNQHVTDRYVFETLTMNADFDKRNPPKDLVLSYFRILYDLKTDNPIVFSSLGDGLLSGWVVDMTDDYLLEVVDPERIKYYKDYLPEGMSLEDIDVEEANPMLAKFYFKRK